MTTFRRQLPRRATSAGTARRLVNGHTAALGAQPRDDAALLGSELVSNALPHGIGTISLRIDVEADGVRVEVSDRGNVAPARSPRPGAHGGWGLRIVEKLADDWGAMEGSTTVRFRLDRQALQH